MKATHLFCASVLGSLALLACANDPVLLPGGSGGSGGAGGGEGGTTTTSSMSGGGGQGGIGNNGGSGGDGGTGGVPIDACEDGCDKITSCTGVDRCTSLSVDCDATPTHPEPTVACIVDCAGQPESTCGDVTAYLASQASTPGPASHLAQCLATCDVASSQAALLECLAGGGGGGGGGAGGGGGSTGAPCLDHITCEEGDTDCTTWFECIRTCTDPGCFSACNAATPGAADNYDPFYACLCNDVSPAATATLILSPVYCTDVVIGMTDACNQ